MRNSKGQFVKSGHYNPKRDNWKNVECPCGEFFKARFCRIKIGKEKYCSRKCSDKYRKKVVWNKNKKLTYEVWNKGKIFLDKRGSSSLFWLGDNVGYSGLHTWVKKNEGETKCL